MTFETVETSRTLGEPIDLYLFVYGPGSLYYGYTDAEEDQFRGDLGYTAVPIMRDTVKSSGTLDKSPLKVSLPADSAIAELFKVYPPSQEVSLFIRQGHLGDPDNEFLIIWSGRVISCQWEDSIAELTCEPIATAMRRAALRRHYQFGCPHALYQGDSSGGCRASKEAATVSTTASGIDGNSLTVPSGWNGSFDKAKFRGGLVEWTNGDGVTESRTILRVNSTTNVLTLGGVIRDLEAGDAVDVVLGCNHQMDDCADLHDNILDFGGQPWIPVKNPFGNTNNFY